MVVLRNLMSNSLKFTPSGGTVCLRFEIQDEQKKEVATTTDAIHRRVSSAGGEKYTSVRLTVSDTGPGMTEEECSRLFKEFVQFNPNKLQQGGGSGIGLYLSHMIAVQHGLHINVRSFQGEGTSFYIDFPLVNPAKLSLSKVAPLPAAGSLIVEGVAGGGDEDSELDHNEQSREAVEGCQMSNTLSRLSVLIADDSPSNRKMLLRTLKQHSVGDQIDMVCDGVELLQHLRLPQSVIGEIEENSISTKAAAVNTSSLNYINSSSGVNLLELKSYGVIMVDNHMPRMGGREAVTKLRRAGYSGLIVGLSGDVSEEDLGAFCHAGANIALPKPFQVSDLKAFLVKELCSKSKQSCTATVALKDE